MEKNNYVYDYETLINCFVAVFTHYKTNEQKVFVVHRLRNDIVELVSFLNNASLQKEWHIGFNNLAFDAQITQFILETQDSLIEGDPQYVANELYNIAQRVIELSNAEEYPLYSERNLSINQIDLYKLNHWDSPAKRSSLKWIQYSMDWHNMLEMPIHHSTFINTLEEIEKVIEYCVNDVLSTKNIMNKSKKLINMRQVLTETYKINLYNASEPKIAKDLFLHFLSKKLGMKKHEIKKLRTYRNEIVVKDLLLDYIKFTSPEFIALHEKFKTLKIDPKNMKGSFSYTMKHKNVSTKFGFGGVHGARDPGIYTSTKDMIIMTSDVN